MKQLALDIGLHAGPTLDNFHAGANEQALQHLRLSLGAAGAPCQALPTYLWGASGSGKTHLLRAVHEQLRGQGARAAWLDAGVAQYTAFDERWSAVLLDDVHQYDSARQALAFNWFINAIHPATGAVRWVLAAGAVPPADLPLRDDLRTRLGWGHVFELAPLAEEGLRAVLRAQGGARGIELSDEVLDFVLQRFSRDLASLTQLVDRLDHFALRTQRAVTIPLLKTMLESE